MEMKAMFKKSALALAIGAFSASSFAGTHVIDAASGPMVLANEIFGTGSQDTLVAVPASTYTVAVASNGFAVGEVVTVKLTLDAGAVFGEDLSDIDKWAASNAALVFGVNSAGVVLIPVGGAGAPYAQNPDVTIVVDQGGAIGDNTVTFKLTNANLGLLNVTELLTTQAGQFSVKNLTGALARGVTTPRVRLGAEFRNVNTTVTDTQLAITVLQSQNGVELTGTATTYEAGGGRARIDVADTEKSFTGNLAGNTGANAAQDYDSTDNVSFVTLGTLQVVRTTYALGAQVVKKENGDEFDFQGSDQPVVTISSTNPLTAYNSIYLRPAANGACTAVVAGTDFAATPAAGATSANISLSGQTTVALENGYTLCARASGATGMPESTFTAELNVTYFNPRYTTSQDTLGYGPVLRNGCQVTLFNVPNVNAADNAFIRLTNVSELPGSVRAFMWTEDGTLIDNGVELAVSLAGHATEVFHTRADLANGVYLGDVMPQFAALADGRHRLVLQGAFPACEALGMVRSPNGTLTNMTSTTSSGDPSRLGSDRSNTSNTPN